MMLPRRRVLAAAVVVLAGIGALLLAGGRVAGCLGPLGVTPIQCAKATGFVPTVGPGLPVAALAISIGLALLAPIPAGRRRGAIVAGAIGALAAAATFAVAWDRTWTGVDAGGQMLSIDRPLDLEALATAAILAAVGGAEGWALLSGPVQSRLARS
jgi:hypothetical protein